MTTRTLGSKFVQGLDVAAIAKLVRADIKAAVYPMGSPRGLNNGELPHGKYSVSVERYTMGRAINVCFSIEGSDFRVFNANRLRFEAANPHACAFDAPADAQARFTPAMDAVIAKLEEILAAYNYSTPDRRNENFHQDVRPDTDWKNACLRAETAQALAEPAARPSSAPTLPAPSARPVAPQVDFLLHLGVEA